MRSRRQIQETQLNMFNLNKFGLRLCLESLVKYLAFDKCCLAKVIFTYYIYLIVDESAARDKNRYSGENNALVSAYFLLQSIWSGPARLQELPQTALLPFHAPFANPTYPAPIIGKYVDVESTVRMVVFPRSTIFSRVVRLYVSSPRILENYSIFHTIKFFFLYFKFITCLLLPNLLRRNKILHVFCHWAMSNWTESRCCATRDKILSLSLATHSLFLCCLLSSHFSQLASCATLASAASPRCCCCCCLRRLHTAHCTSIH